MCVHVIVFVTGSIGTGYLSDVLNARAVAVTLLLYLSIPMVCTHISDTVNTYTCFFICMHVHTYACITYRM